MLFACGLAAAGDAGKPVLDVVEGATKALFWIIRMVMKVAPLGAFGAIAFSVAKFGLGSLVSLGALVGEFYLTCLVFVLLVLLPVSLWARFSLWKLMRYIRAELLLVIGTSSSESVFPQLSAKLTRLGAEESAVGLVLPTGYAFNHDGTCLYFAAVTVFLGPGDQTALGWEDQLALLGVLLLTSKGGAGVAGSALAVLAMTLAATQTIPVGSMALILGIHRVLSAAFVFVNILGNAVATLVVAKWEGALDHKRLDGRAGGGVPGVGARALRDAAVTGSAAGPSRRRARASAGPRPARSPISPPRWWPPRCRSGWSASALRDISRWMPRMSATLATGMVPAERQRGRQHDEGGAGDAGCAFRGQQQHPEQADLVHRCRAACWSPAPGRPSPSPDTGRYRRD